MSIFAVFLAYLYHVSWLNIATYVTSHSFGIGFIIISDWECIWNGNLMSSVSDYSNGCYLARGLQHDVVQSSVYPQLAGMKWRFWNFTLVAHQSDGNGIRNEVEFVFD